MKKRIATMLIAAVVSVSALPFYTPAEELVLGDIVDETAEDVSVEDVEYEAAEELSLTEIEDETADGDIIIAGDEDFEEIIEFEPEIIIGESEFEEIEEYETEEDTAQIWAEDSEGDGEAEVQSGSCGENATWTLTADGVLTISGTGPMTDYPNFYETPWYYSKNDVKELVIEEGITRIGKNAFYYLNISTLSIPDSVTSIGKSAFHGCKNICSPVIIPSGVTIIEDYIFAWCESIPEIVFHEGIKSIGEGSFEYCESLTEINLPESLESIGYGAFEACAATKVTIPKGVTSIGLSAFSMSSLLNIEVDANNTVYTDVEGVLFSKDMKKLIKYPEGKTSISYVVPNGVEEICTWAFFGALFETVTLPDELLTLCDRAFSHCGNLKSISIPDSVTSIGEDSFLHCSSLRNVVLSENLKSIPNGAFHGNTNLKEIYIPEGVTTIERSAFFTCSNLNTITLPLSLKTIEENAFYGCYSIRNIYYAGTGEDWNLIEIGDYNNLSSATLHYGVSSYAYNIGDLWSFPNQQGFIPKDFYYEMFGLWTGDMIYEKDGPEAGQCFGMCLGASAILDGHITFMNGGNDIAGAKQSDDMPYSVCQDVEDYIRRAYLYQNYCQKEKMNNLNDYAGIAHKVWEMLEGDAPIIIDVWNGNGSGHALLPIGVIKEDGRELDIAVYDCINPGVEATLKIFKYDGAYQGFNFDFYENGEYKGSYYNEDEDDDNGFITYVECPYSFSTDIINGKWSKKLKNSYVLSSAKKMSKEAIEKYWPVMYLYHIAFGLAYDENEMYGIESEDGNFVFEGLEAGAEFTITSYTTEATVKILSDANVEVDFSDNGACSVKLNGMSEGSFDVEFKKWDEETDHVDTMKLTGKGKEDISIAYDGSADFSGVTDINISRTGGTANKDLTVDVLSQSEESKQSLNPWISYNSENMDIEPADTPSDPVPSKPEPSKPEPSKPSAPGKVSISAATVTGLTDKTFTGSALTQDPVVKLGSNTLKLNTDYTVSYKDNTNAGTASVSITGVGKYTGTITKMFTIAKAANPLNMKGKTVKVKYSKLKKKKQTLAVSKVISFTENGKGKISYKRASGNKKITISKKTGKVTVKKGLKKGTYKIKVKVNAAGDANYEAATKTVTFKIKVK